MMEEPKREVKNDTKSMHCKALSWELAFNSYRLF